MFLRIVVKQTLTVKEHTHESHMAIFSTQHLNLYNAMALNK